MNQILKMFGGNKSQAALMTGLIGMIGSGKLGGLSGLVDQFGKTGADDQAKSWVSTGENKPIDASQVQQALGPDTLNELAAGAGVSPEQASKELAQMIPETVDKLTPQGQVPDANSIAQQLKGMMPS